MKTTSLFLMIFIMALISCKQEKAPVYDTAAEKVAIKLALQKYIIANEAGNISMIGDLWADDSAVFSIGTDRRDVFKGFNAVKEKFSQQFERFENTFISARDLEIYVHPKCETAWFSEVLQYNYTHGDQAFEYSDLRFTGFLEKRDGKWMILQTHLSSPEDK